MIARAQLHRPLGFSPCWCECGAPFDEGAGRCVMVAPLKPSRLSDLPGVSEEDAAAIAASKSHYAVTVPEMPEGYRLTVANGNGWQSFGWVQEHPSGTVLAVRNGIGNARNAAENARCHSKVQTT